LLEGSRPRYFTRSREPGSRGNRSAAVAGHVEKGQVSLAGVSEFENEEALRQRWRISVWINLISWVTGVWGLFYPRPYALTIFVLLALPWAALLVVHHYAGGFSIDRWRKGSIPHVAAAFFMPSLVLLLRGVLDFKVFDWPRLAFYGVLAGAVLCIAMTIADRSTRLRRQQIIAFYVVAFFYGIGGTALTNGLLDRSTPAVYPTEIKDKAVLRGRTTVYRLTLDPWGPRREENYVEISEEVYNAAGLGDKVCPTVRKGAFGVAWYFVSVCP
jgi:hypothetical protein